MVEILRDMGAEIRWEGETLVSRASKLHGLRGGLRTGSRSCAESGRGDGGGRRREPHHGRGAAAHQGERQGSSADGGGADGERGADVSELPDGLSIRGGKRLHAAKIEGCNDHRIVMAMTMASEIADGELTITDAEATAKSAPAFWREFEHLGGLAR